jgi:hypothetical protein
MQDNLCFEPDRERGRVETENIRESTGEMIPTGLAVGRQILRQPASVASRSIANRVHGPGRGLSEGRVLAES